MKRTYAAPFLEITEYEISDVITVSVSSGPVEGGEDGWIIV